MKLTANSLRWSGLRTRMAPAATAVVAMTATLGALVPTFHSAAPPVWLEAGPELVTQVNACEQRVGRTQGEQCKQDLVTAQLARNRQPTRLATR